MTTTRRPTSASLGRLVGAGVVAWLAAGAAAAENPYSSESACLRAESPEVCAKYFKPAPPPPPAAPLPLAACTEILNQATVLATKATMAEQFGEEAEAEITTRQYMAVAEEAFKCSLRVKSAPRFDQQMWAEAKDRFVAKHAALEALLRAKAAN